MKNSRGFTLMELMVVIGVIGVFAAIIMTQLNASRARADEKKMIAEVRSLRSALELYYDKHGFYPTTGGYYQCTAGTGTNGCTPGTSALQVLVTEGFIPKIPIGVGADGNGVEDVEIFYGAPGWWNTSWGYQIQFQVSKRDDTLGECYGGNCATSMWGSKYMYSVHPQ